MASAIRNVYLHRTADRDGPCWVCSKTSAACLTNEQGDWFFVCVNHLSDASFCTSLDPPVPIPTKSPLNASMPKSKGKSTSKDPATAHANVTASTESSPAHPSPPKPTGPKGFALKSSFMFLRENEKKKKAERIAANQVKSLLPSVPRR
ncbi:hypothetical protein SeMB42_g06691 [Synchytrium endobioticum]|uniref:VPS4-associated protein 1 n=1 Tax=Synchytrium endobioticum TaxID=286115 RepID=A0A507CFW9_9FUNG|nr:hypothetical protein SeMB42_g06691 [Synchytrium endobioticum]TPX50139.1 hypothetical protein SeLEV6574_g01077 [Synchytrium endobioticum]